MITVGLIAVPPTERSSPSAMAVNECANARADGPAHGIVLVCATETGLADHQRMGRAILRDHDPPSHNLGRTPRNLAVA